MIAQIPHGRHHRRRVTSGLRSQERLIPIANRAKPIIEQRILLGNSIKVMHHGL
jgi:hypothetical protein